MDIKRSPIICTCHELNEVETHADYNTAGKLISKCSACPAVIMVDEKMAELSISGVVFLCCGCAKQFVHGQIVDAHFERYCQP